MEIGIFSKTFERPTLTEKLDAIAAHGLYAIQFNMDCAGLESMPDQIDPALSATIRQEMAARQIKMATVSGTYNMIDPDLAQRQLGLQRLRTLIAACHDLGTSIITLCTGTRDRTSMWRRHPDNDLPEAMRDLVAELRQAIVFAETHKVTLAFEPEVNNVIDSARKARQLLDEINSPYLKVVMDGANIFHKGELPRMHEILDEAFALLGNDIALAHAKDLDHDGDAGHLAAGHGLLDYDHYLHLLQRSGYSGTLILHGLDESQVDGCVAFLREKLA
ncbi:MAG: sugar phosphate isomerase/epimerase [Chloroflexi bacterium]|nr:sugar phosphate isomerase/epimerase [Chloroflexota bacterium]